jgi:hypothetical protein
MYEGMQQGAWWCGAQALCVGILGLLLNCSWGEKSLGVYVSGDYVLCAMGEGSWCKLQVLCTLSVLAETLIINLHI